MIKRIFIFPLADSLTLSHVSLPYHIFETRYRNMLEVSLKNNVPIAVLPVSLHPFRGGVAYAGVPKLIQKYSDGRADIVISGDIRFRMNSVWENEYLIADGEELAGLKAPTPSTSIEIAREALQSWLESQEIAQEQKEYFLRLIENDEVLLAYAASFLVKTIEEKMLFLESLSWDEWAQVLIKKIGPREINLGPYLAKLKF